MISHILYYPSMRCPHKLKKSVLSDQYIISIGDLYIIRLAQECSWSSVSISGTGDYLVRRIDYVTGTSMSLCFFMLFSENVLCTACLAHVIQAIVYIHNLLVYTYIIYYHILIICMYIARL